MTKKPQKENVFHQILSFGGIEGLSRVMNWSMMALLPFIIASDGYGKIAIIVSIETLLTNVSVVGLDRAVLRFYENKNFDGPFLKSILSIWIVFAIMPISISIILYLSRIKFIFGIPVFPHIFLLSLITAIYNFNYLFTCISRATRNILQFTILRFFYTLIKFLFVILIVKISGESFSYILGFLLASITMLFFTLPSIFRGFSEKLDYSLTKKIFLFSWPFTLHILSGNILVYFSRFFLQIYNTTEDVALFTLSYTMGSGIYIFYAIFNSYFEPRIYSYSKNIDKCENWLNNYTFICIFFGSTAAFIFLSLQSIFVSYLPHNYSQATKIVPIILGAVLIQPLYLQANYRLTVHQRTKYIALSSMIGAISNLLFCYLLIPKYAVCGAAIAFYISNVIMVLFILISSLIVSGIKKVSGDKFFLYSLLIVEPLLILVFKNTAILIAIFIAITMCTILSLINLNRGMINRIFDFEKNRFISK